MKLSTFSALAITATAATAATVWFTTAPAQGSQPRLAPAAGVQDPIAAIEPSVPKPNTPPLVAEHATFTAGKTLMVTGRLGHPTLPSATDSETFLFVDITSDAGLRAATPAPLDLAIVIDRSGSMKGKRLDNAMAATRAAISRLHDGDSVAVVTYSQTSTIAVEPTVIDTASRQRLLAKFARPQAGGDTCISCGIETAMRLLTTRSGRVSRILLLSDGIATAGVRDVASFRAIAENCRRMGASVTTVGVDIDYDERILAALARDSNGNHFFVRDPSGLPAIFERETESLSKTVAAATDLTIDLAPGVFAEQVFDRVTSANGSQVVIPMGAFTAGEHKTALVRLRIPRSGAAGERPIAAVHLRYDDLVEHRAGNCDGQLAAITTDDVNQLAPLDGEVSARVTASETAAALEQANALVRAGRPQEANQILRDTKIHVNGWRGRLSMKSATAARRANDSFDRQTAALDAATEAFDKAAAPPMGAASGPRPSPDAPATVQAQVRDNQSNAVTLGM
jgi:Ca-activated chloride channel homolog